jgi:hypothetical protein
VLYLIHVLLYIISYTILFSSSVYTLLLFILLDSLLLFFPLLSFISSTISSSHLLLIYIPSPLIHSILVGTYIYLFIFIYLSSINNSTPHVLSEWMVEVCGKYLYQVVFRAGGMLLVFEMVLYYILYYTYTIIIIYLILYYTLLFLPNLSSDLSSIPSLLPLFRSYPLFFFPYNSILFLSPFSRHAHLSFILYLSVLTYTYLYSINIPIFLFSQFLPRTFYRSGWLRCDVFNSVFMFERLMFQV